MKAAAILITVISLVSTAVAEGCYPCAERKGGVVCTTPPPNSHGCGLCCDNAMQCQRFIELGLCK
ncbi:hypothetical protein C8034_v006816 [Colletotrichum sidae]|uniref:Uncharacterized protein n=3 Tax=Colletotrichum orbiculare species complex TaxID=2707354 RepID=A0A4R8QWC5_COLTR|nr:hypothetical protein C8035_v001502 [Colletotrichum spinosum]TDZ46930.1 hypothetical protein CTRI78_v008824 [Colletotrichum trifolii]TEA11976.1 hypothetical protein C8034_v006816 [Colletotrichum sidae]